MNADEYRTFAQPNIRTTLQRKKDPYFYKISDGKFLGYRRPKRGAGTWIAQIRFGRPERQKRLTFAKADDETAANGKDVLTFEEALIFANGWFNQPYQLKFYQPKALRVRQEGLIVCPCGQDYTVNHALADFLAWKREHESSTGFYPTVCRFNRYVVPVIGTIPLSELKPMHLYGMMHEAVKGGRNRSHASHGEMDAEVLRRRRLSANYVMCNVRSALNQAWENGKVDDDKGWRPVRLFRGVTKPRVDMLSHSQCLALLRHCDPDIRELVLGGLYTGCRVGELIKIQAEDLNRHRASLFIRPYKTNRARHVALPEEGFDFFRGLAHGRGRNEKLFRSSAGMPWRIGGYAERFKEALQRAGQPTHYVFHVLRHTYASLLIQNNASPLAVARQLGHAGLQTVMKTYAHCADDFVDVEIRNKFEPIISADPQLASELATRARERSKGGYLKLVYAASE